jgi:hypothetical protein
MDKPIRLLIRRETSPPPRFPRLRLSNMERRLGGEVCFIHEKADRDKSQPFLLDYRNKMNEDGG